MGFSFDFFRDPISYFMTKSASRHQQHEIENQQRQAAADQAARQNALSSVDQQFAGFTPDYYSKIENDAKTYYNSELSRQYEQARQELIRRLGTTGLMDTSTAARLFGNLGKENVRNQQNIAAQAINDRQRVQSQIETAKGGLIDRVNSGGDLGSTITSAGEEAARLTQPPQFSLAGDLFGGFLQGLSSTIRDNPTMFANMGGGTQFPTATGRERVV